MRGNVWKKAVTRYVLPQLDGDWLMGHAEIVRKPIGYVVCTIFRINSNFGVGYQLFAGVQGLYVPEARWITDTSILLRHPWAGFATPEDGEEEMRHTVRLIKDEGVPFFDKHGTLEGYRHLCGTYGSRNEGGGVSNPHSLRHEAMTEVVLERYSSAAKTFSMINSVYLQTGSTSPWFTDLVAEATSYQQRLAEDPTAVRDSLLANIPLQKEKLKLPAD